MKTTPSTDELVNTFLDKFVGEIIRDTRRPVQKAEPHSGHPAKKKATQLLDLHVEEVSAVDHPANRRKFLVVKRAGGAEKAREAIGAVPLVDAVVSFVAL